MIGPANEVVFPAVIKIIIEIIVQHRETFRRFYDNEAHRCAVDVGITQPVPINFALVVGNVNTVDRISRRELGFAKDTFPPERCGAHKEVVEYERIGSQHQHPPTPYSPCGPMENGAPTAAALTAFPFFSSLRYFFLCQT